MKNNLYVPAQTVSSDDLEWPWKWIETIAENCFVPDCSGVVTTRAFVTVNLLIEHFENEMPVY